MNPVLDLGPAHLEEGDDAYDLHSTPGRPCRTSYEEEQKEQDLGECRPMDVIGGGKAGGGENGGGLKCAVAQRLGKRIIGVGSEKLQCGEQ